MTQHSLSGDIDKVKMQDVQDIMRKYSEMVNEGLGSDMGGGGGQMGAADLS